MKADLSSSSRYAKLRLCAEKLAVDQTRDSASKLFKKVLNDAARDIVSEPRKGSLLGAVWKINTLIAKAIQGRGREQDNPVNFGMPGPAADYLFLKIFSDEETPTSQKTEEAIVRYFATQNKDTHWKRHDFEVSFQDVTDTMKKIIDSI